MKIKLITFIWIISFLFLPAFAKNEIKNDIMTPCTYIPHSITKPTLAGIKLSQGVNFSIVSKVGSILAGNTSSVPLDFIINLEVINPNQKKISLQSMDYILRVDNIEFSRGSLKKTFKIQASNKRILPLSINLELSELLKGNTSNAVQNMIKNFMKSGSKQTNISLQLKPSYKVGKEIITAPHYIPVNFSFQGKK